MISRKPSVRYILDCVNSPFPQIKYIDFEIYFETVIPTGYNYLLKQFLRAIWGGVLGCSPHFAPSNLKLSHCASFSVDTIIQCLLQIFFLQYPLHSPLLWNYSSIEPASMFPYLILGSDGKSVCLQCGRPGFDFWFWKIPWRRKWQSTPALLPGKSYGRRSLIGYSPWGCKESDTTEQLHFHYIISQFYHNYVLYKWFP